MYISLAPWKNILAWLVRRRPSVLHASTERREVLNGRGGGLDRGGRGSPGRRVSVATQIVTSRTSIERIVHRLVAYTLQIRRKRTRRKSSNPFAKTSFIHKIVFRPFSSMGHNSHPKIGKPRHRATEFLDRQNQRFNKASRAAERPQRRLLIILTVGRALGRIFTERLTRKRSSVWGHATRSCLHLHGRILSIKRMLNT